MRDVPTAAGLDAWYEDVGSRLLTFAHLVTHDREHRDHLDASDTEIAEVLGCEPSTVRSHLHRARRALRDLLERTEE